MRAYRAICSFFLFFYQCYLSHATQKKNLIKTVDILREKFQNIFYKKWIDIDNISFNNIDDDI